MFVTLFILALPVEGLVDMYHAYQKLGNIHGFILAPLILLFPGCRPMVSNWTSHLNKLAAKMGLGSGVSSQNHVEMENFPNGAASTTSGRSGVHRVRPALA